MDIGPKACEKIYSGSPEINFLTVEICTVILLKNYLMGISLLINEKEYRLSKINLVVEQW